MAAPRKIFRIEETAAARHPGAGAEPVRRFAMPRTFMPRTFMCQNLSAQDLSAQASMPRTACPVTIPVMPKSCRRSVRCARRSPHPGRVRQRAPAAEGCVTTALQTAQLTRIVQELEAVAADTAQATQKILAAAEEIDQLANNLAAALKGKLEQGAAQDISDLIICIFEACNFQDLSGQRIAKVRTTLKFLEHPSTPEQNADKSAPPRDDAAQLLHGPRLDGDTGHITQAEIDALFDNYARHCAFGFMAGLPAARGVPSAAQRT